jgi:hypothetical protein
MSRAATLLIWMAGLAAIAATAVGTITLAKDPSDTPKGTMAMTLKVRDYSHLNRSILLGAEQEATGILAQAGVSARWTDCPTSPGDLASFPNCQPPWQVNDYVMNVMPDSMAALLGKSDDALGLATECGMGPSCTASVFFDRVSKLAGGDRAPAQVLLGRAMAHEIGHLLLGANSHSPTGIMRGHWAPREFRLDARLDLLFTTGQSRRMRSRLAEREQLSQVQSKIVEAGH